MKPTVRQTTMRYSIYAQLALDVAAAAVELWFFWGDGANFVPVLVLMLLSAANICWLGHHYLNDCKQFMTSEAYQRLAARYFSYGSRGRWLWMLLQYRQIKAASDEAGLALLRIWLAGDVLICVSMLGMYLPAELILG